MALVLTIHIDEFEGEPAGCVLSGRWSIVGKDGMTRATIAGCIAELRDSSISPERAQLEAARMVAAINLQDGLDNGRPLILGT